MKKVTDGTTTSSTDYLTGFQYSSGVLNFFPHKEGYVLNSVQRNGDQLKAYVYNHTDHLGNIRLSFQDKNKDGTIADYWLKDPYCGQVSTYPGQNGCRWDFISETIEENNYYPFGLKHKGYNDNSFAGNYKYKYQGQERQDELGLNWDSFKWRNYDFAIGRFFNIDPLSEKYVYNGVYNFSENRVIDARELEGLEKVLIFGGADLLNTGLSQTTNNIQNSIQKFSDKNKLGFEVKSYNSSPWSPAHEKAFLDIMSNYTEGEKLIIYGYSLGGVGATQLTKLLKSQDVKVDLLVTIDPAFGPFGKEINIPDNVEKVDNTYQENRSLIGSRGFPATPINGNEKTEIKNHNITDKTTGKGIDAHGTIDEDTMKKSIQLIQQEMQKKTNND